MRADPLAVTLASTPSTPRPRSVSRVFTPILLLWQLLRGLTLLCSTALIFVVLTALAGAWIVSAGQLVSLGLAAGVLMPLFLLVFLRRRLGRRLGRRTSLGGRWFVVAVQLAMVATLALGFSQSMGRALRRRGDWFVGSAQGWLPRQLRRGIQQAAVWLERFDAPPELTALTPTPPTAPPPTAPTPAFPILPLAPLAPAPTLVPWSHPLAARDGERLLPPNASCRFGAHRADVRRRECELGHCGVDLFAPVGTPIHAIADGRVLRVERDEARGGRAGRYLILTHRRKAVRSYYVHVESIAAGLRAGDRVRAGQQVATLGRTGIKRSAAHLHFAVELRRRSGWRYIDPEPLLWTWSLPGVRRERLARLTRPSSSDR